MYPHCALVGQEHPREMRPADGPVVLVCDDEHFGGGGDVFPPDADDQAPAATEAEEDRAFSHFCGGIVVGRTGSIIYILAD